MKLRPTNGTPLALPGVRGVAAAINLDRFDPVPAEYQLRTLLAARERVGRTPLCGFETSTDARLRLTNVRRSLSKVANALEAQGRRQAANEVSALVAALKVSPRPHGLPNLVNPLFVRALRNRFISHLILAVQSLDPGVSVRTYTIVIDAWRLTADRLARFHRDDILEPLRAHLTRLRLAELPGWCFVGLHGEHRQGDNLVHLHFHVLVVGEKWRAFEALRGVPAYAGGKGAPILHPIVWNDLDDVPRQLAYLLQGWWPSKLPTGTPGVDDGARRRRRIPEPLQGQCLLWMGRQRFTDIVWLHGIQIRGGRLVPTGEVA